VGVAIAKLTPFAEVGDFVEQDEEIATIETDKASTLDELLASTF
jgi:hypothetical protein